MLKMRHVRLTVENIIGECGVCDSSIAGDNELTSNVVNLTWSDEVRSDKQ